MADDPHHQCGPPHACACTYMCTYTHICPHTCKYMYTHKWKEKKEKDYTAQNEHKGVGRGRAQPAHSSAGINPPCRPNPTPRPAFILSQGSHDHRTSDLDCHLLKDYSSVPWEWTSRSQYVNHWGVNTMHTKAQNTGSWLDVTRLTVPWWEHQNPKMCLPTGCINGSQCSSCQEMIKDLTEIKVKIMGTPGHILLQTRDYRWESGRTSPRPALRCIISIAKDHIVEKFDS